MKEIEGEILEKDIKMSDVDETVNKDDISINNAEKETVKNGNRNITNQKKKKNSNKNVKKKTETVIKKDTEKDNIDINEDIAEQENIDNTDNKADQENIDNNESEKNNTKNIKENKVNKNTPKQKNNKKTEEQKSTEETAKKENHENTEKANKKDDNIKNEIPDEKIANITADNLSILKQSEETTIISKIKDMSKKKKVIILISIICFIIVFLLFSTMFALVNSNSNKIISGTYIKGIDVSGLTRDEAKEKLDKIISEKKSSEYILSYGDYNTKLIPEQAEVTFDIDSSIRTAFERGRTNNIFADNYEIVFSGIYKKDIIPSFSYNEEFIDNLVTEMQEHIPNKLIEPGYYIEDDYIIITKGVDGLIINSDLLKLKFISNINDFTSDNKNIEIPVQNATAKDIDIEKIHAEIYKEPKDAYYTTEPFCVYPHEIGVDFAISIEEAKELLKENKESYSIELSFTTPNVTTNQIGSEAFPDLLGEYSTTYSSSNVNRSTNIALASSKVDGTVLMPGETFSYNATVGKRTPQAGFKPAAVYSGGQVTTDYGGGICQVSSTLYNAVLLSNLEIVERYNHGFNPGYVPAGRDATVSWGSPDFKFKNTRSYPIRVECTGTGGRIIAQIFGLKEANEYEVEIESYVTSYIPYKTVEQIDSRLDTGETRVIESGSNGCRSVCYRILSQNGEVVSKDLLSSDTYNPHNRVIAVGP